MNLVGDEEGREQPRELYRDELNFAEFPLASVSTSIPKHQKTLEFSDTIFDKARNKEVTRKLTITASDKYGLPTAMDDDVILGLIQLTAKADFVSRRVFFTRYQLLKLLDWSDDTRNYDRLEQSLNRWLGVTLYYDKSWWSKEEQSWVNEGFHILDHVTIFDRERQLKKARSDPDSGKSSFVWNEVVFNSFKAGYLKRIDFDFYKQLQSAVSKRMYRFLDKRFYHRERLEFDLRTFACEHIGMSKKYHNGELKRVLTLALAELEQEGFLKPLPTQERFIRKNRGHWSIALVHAKGRAEKTVSKESELVNALCERGLSIQSARRITASHDETKIREKMAVFDWLRSKSDQRIRRSPAGFLYRSIVDDFQQPPDFQMATSQPKVCDARRKVVAIRTSPAQAEPAPELSSDRDAIEAFWNSIPESERQVIEKQLVKDTTPFLRHQYRESEESRGVLFRVVRQQIIDAYVRKAIREKAA